MKYYNIYLVFKIASVNALLLDNIKGYFVSNKNLINLSLVEDPLAKIQEDEKIWNKLWAKPFEIGPNLTRSIFGYNRLLLSKYLDETFDKINEFKKINNGTSNNNIEQCLQRNKKLLSFSYRTFETDTNCLTSETANFADFRYLYGVLEEAMANSLALCEGFFCSGGNALMLAKMGTQLSRAMYNLKKFYDNFWTDLRGCQKKIGLFKRVADFAANNVRRCLNLPVKKEKKRNLYQYLIG